MLVENKTKPIVILIDEKGDAELVDLVVESKLAKKVSFHVFRSRDKANSFKNKCRLDDIPVEMVCSLDRYVEAMSDELHKENKNHENLCLQ